VPLLAAPSPGLVRKFDGVCGYALELEHVLLLAGPSPGPVRKFDGVCGVTGVMCAFPVLEEVSGEGGCS